MKLVVTADLHFNHRSGRAAADAAVEEINRTPGDVLLIVGDTAAGDGDMLERSLAGIIFSGPKLFLAGNHELWTASGDSYALFTEEMPRRVRSAGWQWLETDPFEADGVAIVGSIGWYDYAFAPPDLGIPRRFYEAKISPGAAGRLSEHAALLGDDVPASARDIVVRWNDGRHISLGRSDESFLDECLSNLRRSLTIVTASKVLAAVHHVPFAELMPPRRAPTFDFVRAFFGSPRLGEQLAGDLRVSHVLCGHTHSTADVHIGSLRAVNIGSTYTAKRVLTITL
ncbi:MAG: metallophosphoesterase [Phycisphaerales bacterium]|nr:metallophosphoesterase [Phycisphaerales bacterium]